MSNRTGRERNFTKEENEAIIQAYLDNKSLKEICSQFRCGKTHIFKLRKSNSIASRNFRNARRYNLDEDFFEIIDTEEKAYWLGFIIADGNIVTLPHPCLKIALARKDIEHLNKFRTSIKSNYLIYEYYRYLGENKYEQCKISVYSKKIVSDLMNLGVTPNKSLTAIVPEGLQNSSHFWRGVIDGDGCIAVDKRGNPILHLVGSEYIVSAFKEYTTTLCGSKAKCRQSKKSYTIAFGGRNVVGGILENLYTDATIYLERKKELANELLSIGFSRKSKRETNYSLIEVYKESF